MNLLSTRQRARLKASAIALAFLGAAPGLSLPAARSAESDTPPPITWEASFVDTGFKTQVMHLKDVTITYGKMTVKADRALATSGDFKNSRWTFDGNVRINADPRGNLRSDEAIVEFEDSQLKRATATGNPAEFDQKRADPTSLPAAMPTPSSTKWERGRCGFRTMRGSPTGEMTSVGP